MIVADLIRSKDSSIQRVLDITREMPAQRGSNLLTQYYALKDITNGLRAAIQGLIDLQKLYAPDKVSFKLLSLSESLEDYHSIARTVSIETLEEIGRILEIEMRQLEEPDGNPKAPAPQA